MTSDSTVTLVHFHKVTFVQECSMVMNHNMDTPNEADDLNQHMERVNTAFTSRARGAQYTGVLRLAALCLGLMCVLQATLNIALRLHTHHQAARDQLQGGCVNLTLERDQFQTRYNKLNTERDQLQTRYNNLNTQRDKLQNERDRLQQLVLELKKDEVEWTFFRFSLYYISTETKNWDEARQFCKRKNADLVIINSKEEQEFIHMLREGKEAWIGLTDRIKKGDWRWVDATALQTGYWHYGKPNNAGDEDCAITGYGSYKILNWADYPCNDQFVWICEKGNL